MVSQTCHIFYIRGKWQEFTKLPFWAQKMRELPSFQSFQSSVATRGGFCKPRLLYTHNDDSYKSYYSIMSIEVVIHIIYSYKKTTTKTSINSYYSISIVTWKSSNDNRWIHFRFSSDSARISSQGTVLRRPSSTDGQPTTCLSISQVSWSKSQSLMLKSSVIHGDQW